MARTGQKRYNDFIKRTMIGIIAGISVVVSFSSLVSGQEISPTSHTKPPVIRANITSPTNLSSQRSGSNYKHVWPEMRFGWKIMIGGIIGFVGAAFGSVGGVGGGGIFVPMLTLIIGFDQKSSIAISKCMVMGGAIATVIYNLRQKHPTNDELPIIDYDLALLLQPMLILGISLGVAFNLILPEWIIILLLIVVFLATSTKSFLKGIETWKKETITKKVQSSSNNDKEDVKYNSTNDDNNLAESRELEISKEVHILNNIYWKEFGLLFAVWVIILALQIAKNYTKSCSFLYWLLNVSQIPATVGVTMYEAIRLYRGRRRPINGRESTEWGLKRLTVCSGFGILAGMLGGLLGLGGGFIMAPLFLHLGFPPQVSSATTTLIMAFSSSMTVVEYYLLKRFPLPYALYFGGVAMFSAVVGQFVVGKAIKILGRASLIIFILSSMIFISALTLGGVGIARTVDKIHRREYLGFENICHYH